MIEPGIKRGTAELAVLSVLEDGPLHGYEVARRIERQTKGKLRFTLASLYPLLYRMESKRLVRGAWEVGNGRRRRCYRLTPAGKKKLSPLRREWAELFRALRRLTKVADA
jgi:PadR family transcriptional regulator, regulatory protein PadR